MSERESDDTGSHRQGSVFVSYAGADRQRVEPLVAALAAAKLDVWWDQDIEPGTLWRQAIQERLDRAACVVVVWTRTSVTSGFVWSEASRGQRRTVILPVLLDRDAQVPVGFDEIQHASLADWDGRGETPSLRRLVSRVREMAARGPRDFRPTLEEGAWQVQSSVTATAELRGLTDRLRSIGEILAIESLPARDLDAALGEVGKTYAAVRSAITRFLAPALVPGPLDPQPFIEMERGELTSDIERGRGHCERIATLYGRYGGLRDAIKGRIAADVLHQADETFGRLGIADGDLFAQLMQIGEVLTGESRAIIDMLFEGRGDAARQRIAAGRAKLAPLERDLAAAITELQQIQRSLGHTSRS
jgi:hypothetical protein